MTNLNNSQSSLRQSIPESTGVLLLISIALWLICLGSPSFNNLTLQSLSLHYWGSDMFNPMQLVSYMFVFGSFTHIFFNMFALYIFGSQLERVWGSWRFLTFYLICGVGGGLVQELVWTFTWTGDYISLAAYSNGIDPDAVRDQIYDQIVQRVPERMANVAMYQDSLIAIGSAGAIFGLLAGFAFVFPDMPMRLFFIATPIKAKYMAIAYGVLEFLYGVAGSFSRPEHYAPLGGLIIGLIIIFIWYKRGILHGKFF